MAIQGISGLPNPAIFNTNSASVTDLSQKEEDLTVTKVGAVQNSKASAADAVTASLYAVAGKDTSAQMGRYTDLCSTLLAQQAKCAGGAASYYNAAGTAFQVTYSASIINLSIDMTFDESDLAKLEGMTPEEAEQAVSKTGYWGVDAVSSRIMDMAAALSGGDPDKIDLLQEAVLKGFDNAFAALGGKDSAPDITQQTQAEVKRRFEFWRENGTLEGYASDSEA